MIRINDIKQVEKYIWEIPRGYRPDMRVPVRIFTTKDMLEKTLTDRSLEQAVNCSTLPGLVGKVIVMPDIHQGYGFPIGGVAATQYPKGVISPGAIGYDINCGVRLLASSIETNSAKEYFKALSIRLNQLCPSGVGSEGLKELSKKDFIQILGEGSRWALSNGYATESDLERTEENGSLTGAKPDMISERALTRGLSQLGSLGAGNHFIEVDSVTGIYDDHSAKLMGLKLGCLVVQIHTGSRGLGHQVCTDYVKDFQLAAQRYGIHLPDRELVCAPLDSPEGTAYLGAMRVAANFAFVNRQLLAHACRQAFSEIFYRISKNQDLHQVYDLAHNIGKVENHQVNGVSTKVCVHRKGATRAFGPGSAGLPPEYQEIGQPVLVPGSMGTASWVLTGTSKSMDLSIGSCCHGAGRLMSRSQAKKEIRGSSVRLELEEKGIHIQAGSMAGLAEEAPETYKNVDDVVDVVCKIGIVKKVAKLEPIIVIKG